jgi:2,4-dienoyl-CoA reductase-like NADH-dependent reductase (Old Yellow Enzyme family)
MTTKNRVVMAPMVRNYGDEQGHVTDKYLAHIARVAQGGVGTMILEASYVSPEGKGFTNELGLHNDDIIAGLQRLTAVAHQHSARIGPQLYHAGRQTSSAVTGMQPVAPSSIPDPTINEIPHALTVDEIHQIIEAFAKTAKLCMDAGVDGIEVHAVHEGYLLDQFTMKYTNQRTDEYGGSFENRYRFPVEIVKAIKKSCGKEFPVSLRYSVVSKTKGFRQGAVPGENDFVEVGRDMEESEKAAKHLQDAGYDMLNFDNGTYDAWYSVYMAKNCFRFCTPLISECGQESNDLRQFVLLDPKGYEESNEYDSPEGLVYKTDNIRYFLEPPR